jgi:hypothetical protein
VALLYDNSITYIEIMRGRHALILFSIHVAFYSKRKKGDDSNVAIGMNDGHASSSSWSKYVCNLQISDSSENHSVLEDYCLFLKVHTMNGHEQTAWLPHGWLKINDSLGYPHMIVWTLCGRVHQ